MRSFVKLLIPLALIQVCTCIGCGSSEVPKPKEDLVPVSGSVKLKDKAEEGIQVIFNPVGNNTKSRGGTAVTNSEGEFSLKNFANQDGLPVGEYAVTFSMMRTADGSVHPKGAPPIPGVSAVEKIPPKWNDLKKQGPHNLVKVPAGGKDDFEFKITDK